MNSFGQSLWGVVVAASITCAQTAVAADPDSPTTLQPLTKQSTEQTGQHFSGSGALIPSLPSEKEPVPGAGVCSEQFEEQLDDLFLSPGLSDNFEEALSGYSLSRNQIKKIKERCFTEGERPVIRVVDPGDSLECNFRLRKKLRALGKDDGNNNKVVMFVLPGQEYSLPERIKLNRYDPSITFCGVADLIDQGGGSGDGSSQTIQSEYFVHGQAIDIPPRELLTRLEFTADDRNKYPFIPIMFSYHYTNKLRFSGLNIDATKVKDKFSVFDFRNPTGNQQFSAFQLNKSYIRSPHQAWTIFIKDIRVDISNAIVESIGHWAILIARSSYDVSITHSAFIHLGHDIKPPGSYHAIFIDQWVYFPAFHRIENTLIRGNQGNLVGISMKPKGNYAYAGNILIKDVEFSAGVVLPFDSKSYGRPALVNVRPGSIGNTWTHPSGEFATKGCNAPLRRGFVEFQRGILCDSAMPMIVKPPEAPDSSEPASNALKNSAQTISSGILMFLLPLTLMQY